MLECESGEYVDGEFVQCGAPASITYTYDLTGVDNGGEDAIYVMQRINCAAGHWYDAIESVIA